ncbi:MAG: c-type cytochrome [Gammaproteobacteria bacterium]|jgi:thiosulfate dehydrogenase
MFSKRLISPKLFLSLLFFSAATHADSSVNTHPDSHMLVEMIRGDRPYHQSPAMESIPDDRYGGDVDLGFKIFTQTRKYAGRYSGNNLKCSSCHLDSGRKPNAAPLWAAYGMYPAYRKKNDQNNTLEERIQQCFRFSLDGFAPALDAPEIKALVSYAHFLARGIPVGIDLPGRGYPQIVDTGFDPSPSRGENIYQQKCVECHGQNGEGILSEEQVIFPPLWGLQSYNKGAGFFQNNLLAGFIRANMPLGQDWSLTDQEALDLAAYINLQIRPPDPRKGLLEGLLE